MNKIIRDEACPSCRSHGRDRTGNHLMVFEDGGKYCNRCGYTETLIQNKENKWLTMEEIGVLPYSEILDRKISKKIAEDCGIKVEYSQTNREPLAHYYPRHNENGELIGYQRRGLPKTFTSVGTGKGASLVGKERYGNASKLVIVTEGDLDRAAAMEMLAAKGKAYRVVSLPNGANIRALEQDLEWLEAHETVVFCFDQDKPGKELADKACALLSPGKAKIMHMSEKDACDMWLNGKTNEFFAALFNAKVKRPDGIVSGKDTWERIKNRPEVKCLPYPEEWEELNKKTYGLRLGELDTFTSGSGMGKSQLLRELEYHILTKTEDSIGVIALEEPLEDSVESLMSLHLNKRIHLPDVRNTVSEEDYEAAWKATSGTNRIHYYDHFGSVDDDSLVAKIRYLAKGEGCKYIFLDHLSIVVSEFAAEGGERERIDTIMTRLKRLTQELNIWIGLVVHLRKTTTGGKSFEEGAVPSLDDLRGSGAIKQLSNGVYAISRDQQHPNDVARNTSLITVLKCRFTGQTGGADKLYFNADTGRMTVVEDIPEDPKEKF